MNKTDCKKVKSIKLIVVGMLFLFILCGMAFAKASNSADAVVDLIDAEYRFVYDAENDIEIDFVNIRFRVTNQLSESKAFEPYVAFYTSQNQLRDFKFAEAKTISADGSAEFLVESDVLFEEEGILVKVFVWDDNYAPCADIVPYSIDKGNTTLSVAGTTIQNKSFNTLTITEDIGDGEVTLNNVSVGELIVEGGGSNSIKLKGCTVRNKITAQKKSGNAPRILLENTPVDKIEVIEPAIIEASDTTSVISEIVTVEEVKIQGANTRVKKLEIDEKTEKEIGIGVPDGMELELEINSDNGFELIEGSADNFEFSTACEDIADKILETIKDIVSHIHVWKEEAEVTLGYKTYKCSKCEEFKNPSDRIISFNIGDFASFDSSAGEIEYFSDKANGIKASAKLDIDAEKASDFILYNGSALESKNPADYIGNNYSAVIMVNSTYSGRVVLIDNDFEAGYDIISIEMPVYGVVDEVKSNGRVVFKNAVRDPYTHETARIFVNGEDYNSILTKNGKPISGSELKENDVLSVMWNPDVWNMKKFCYVEVVDKKIEGSVTVAKTSLTSASNNAAYCLNNVTDKFYDVGYNAYRNAEIKLGAEGAFVIDKYDKIVAFFKPTSNMHSNYGYVLAATSVVDDWGKLNVRMQILDDSNEVQEAYLAQEVEISNYAALLTASWNYDGMCEVEEFEGYYDYACDVFDIQDFVPETGAPAFAAAIQNQLVTYETNAAGEIDTIGFATTNPDTAEDNGWLYQARYSTSGNSYDEADSDISVGGGIPFIVTDDTLVFCINGADGLGDYTMASKTVSGVTDKKILSKISDTTPVALYDVNGKDEASVVVIYNVDYEREETGGEQVITDCGYGYVLAATAMSDDWGKTNVRMQILDDSGEVYETCLANEVEIPNIPYNLLYNTFVDGGQFLTYPPANNIYCIEDFALDRYDANASWLDIDNCGASEFAATIQNQLITYKTNATGEISAIAFATTNQDTAKDNGWLYMAAYSYANNSYNGEDSDISVGGGIPFIVTDDTLVFCINGHDNLSGLGDAEHAIESRSGVTNKEILSKISATTPVAVYDVSEYDEASVVVIYNVDYEREETGGEQVITDCGYGYVLAATAVADDWGRTNVIMQILDDSGEVYETCLAEEVEISNYADLLTVVSWNAGMYEVAEFEGCYDNATDIFSPRDFRWDGANAFAATIQNQLITYKTNTSGEISGIGFATTNQDTAEEQGWLYCAVSAIANANAYDDADKELRVGATSVFLTEDTKVFYINSENGYITGLGDYTAASKTASMVARIGSIGSIPVGSSVAVYDINENEEAAVVVLYNMIAGISPNANVAVIAEPVGHAIDNGEKVCYVEYFMNGEKKAATTYVNLPAYSKAALASASFGDVFKFAFDESGKKIMAAQQCIAFSDRCYDGTTAVMTNADWFAEAVAGVAIDGFAVKYNPAYKRITLADANDLTTETGLIKAANANVYIYEPSKIANKLYVGEARDINVEEEVIEKTPSQYITDRNGNIIVGTADSVVGLLDYVAAFKNADGEVIDVVIYKPYDFGVYWVN